MSESKQVFIEPRTPEWYAWRNSGVGASEVAALMGTAKFDPKTPDALRKQKLLGSAFTGNTATEHGVENEAKALADAESMLDLHLAPACFERGNLRASLDGWSADMRIVVEVKCPYKSKLSSRDYAMQPHIQDQVQAQMYCSGGVAAYVCIYQDGDAVLYSVPRDEKRIAEIVASVDAFMPTCVLRDDELFADAEADYLAAKMEVEAAEAKLAKAKECLLMLADSKPAVGRAVCISERSRAGSVDYAKVPELKGVDLEPYRKAGTTYFVIDQN